MDIVERLHETTEKGADPDTIFEAAEEIERLRMVLHGIAIHHETQRGIRGIGVDNYDIENEEYHKKRRDYVMSNLMPNEPSSPAR